MYWYISPITGYIYQLPNEAEAVHYSTGTKYIVFMADLTMEGI